MTPLILRNFHQKLAKNLLSRSFTQHRRCLSSATGLDLSFKDDIAVITMSNQDNRLNISFLNEFNHLLDSVEENVNCKGLITTGAGKFYSNGIDLPWCSQLTKTEEVVDFLQKLNAFLLRILMFPMPTLAMINGHAFAGGAMMASAHDLRVMNSNKGWMCFNEVFLKIRFSEVMFSYLKIKLGGGKNLADALVLGRRFTAQEALNNQMIHAIAPEESQKEESIKLLKTVLAKDGIPRDGVSMMKNHVYRPVQQAYEMDMKDRYMSFADQFINEKQKK